MATPSQSGKKSKTSPQHAKMLRDIMFLDMVTAKRNSSFDQKRKEFIKKKKSLHKDLSPDQIKAMSESFTRRYYAPETKATMEHEVLRRELEGLREKAGTSPLTIQEKRRSQELEFFVEMPVETYVSQKMLDRDTIRTLKAEYPDVESKLKSNIKSIADSEFSDVTKSVSHQPATVALFNQKYPGLKEDLMGQMKSADPERSMTAKAGLAMLQTGAALANPTGYLVSRGIMGIVMSKPLAPLRTKISTGISNTAEKSGLKGWMKSKFTGDSSVLGRRVAMGLGVASAVVMVGIGLSDLERTAEIYTNVFDYFGDSPDPLDASPAVSDTPLVYANGSIDGVEMSVLDEAFLEPTANLVDSPLDPSLEAPDVLANAPEVKIEDYHAGMGEAGPSSVVSNDAPEVVEPVAETSSPETAAPVAETSSPEKALEDETSPETINEQNTPSEGLENNLREDVGAGEPPEVVAEAPKNLEHKVVAGETLSEIIEEHLQNSNVSYDWAIINDYVQSAAEANGISDPDLIYAGTTIQLPDVGQGAPLVEPSEVTRSAGGMIDMSGLCEPSSGLDSPSNTKGIPPLMPSDEFWRSIESSEELNADPAGPAVFALLNSSEHPVVDTQVNIDERVEPKSPHLRVS
jgi:hypothetical protein